MWLWEEAICGDRRRLYVVMGGGYMATYVVIGGGYMATCGYGRRPNVVIGGGHMWLWEEAIWPHMW